jgi:hypothetical protein
MYVYNTIQFCVEAYTATTHLQMELWLTSTVWNVTVSGISVSIVTVLRLDRMRFVCLLAVARHLLYMQTSDQPLAHLACCSVDVVDPSPALKHLIYEADHLSLFSSEVTDECSCNCACGECLHGVHRDSFTFYCRFVGMTAISTWT